MPVVQQQEWITQVLSTPDGKHIISSGVDGRIVISDASTGTSLKQVQLAAPVMAISLAGDGGLLAAGDSSGMVSLVDIHAGNVTAAFKGDTQIVNTVAWTLDGKTVAAAGSDGIVRLAGRDAKITSEISPGHGDVTALAFCKEGLVVGIRGNSKSPKTSAELWDWRGKKLVRSFDEGPAGLRGISVSPDGQLLAIADYQQPTLLTMTPAEGNKAEASLRVLPESDEGTLVAIWETATGKRVGLINAETGARALAFSPDGTMLATGGPNGVVIHETGTRTFTEIGRVDSQNSVDAVAFTPDSKRLLISREREPLVRYGSGGTDKLVDPFFTSIVMQVRQGLTTGVMAKIASTSIPVPERKATTSVTGGSNIDIWEITRQTSPRSLKTWDAVRVLFDGKTEEARKTLEAVAKDDPNYGEALRLLAVLFSGNDLNKAQSQLEAAVKADADCVSCWRSLGDLQFKLEEYPEAIKSYDRTLRLRPEYGLVAGHQAEAYGALGMNFTYLENSEKNMTAAKGALTSALRLRPGVAQFYSNLAAAYYFRGEFDEDIKLLLIAKRLRPDHARIYYNLGHAYRASGSKKLAIEAYQTYVQLGEKGEETRVEKAKQLIAELSK